MRAEEIVLAELAYHPEGLATIAIIDVLERRAVPASVALETVWRLRDARRVAMRNGRIVLGS